MQCIIGGWCQTPPTKRLPNQYVPSSRSRGSLTLRPFSRHGFRFARTRMRRRRLGWSAPCGPCRTPAASTRCDVRRRQPARPAAKLPPPARGGLGEPAELRELAEYQDDGMRPSDPVAPDLHVAHSHEELAARRLRRSASSERWQRRKPISESVPFMPSNSRSFQSGRRRRPRRPAGSRPAPDQRVPRRGCDTARPSQIATNNRSKPGRDVPPPDRPRSCATPRALHRPAHSPGPLPGEKTLDAFDWTWPKKISREQVMHLFPAHPGELRGAGQQRRAHRRRRPWQNASGHRAGAAHLPGALPGAVRQRHRRGQHARRRPGHRPAQAGAGPLPQTPTAHPRLM